jgi:methanogenesis imperfect marker protein 11
LVQILTPEEVQARTGRMFCKRFLTMVDEKNGKVQFIETCSSVGPAEWDAVNRRRTGGVIKSVKLKSTMLITTADIGEGELRFGPVSQQLGAMGIKSIKIEGDEVRSTWYGMAGASVGIGACMPACPDVLRTEFPDDFKMGGGHTTHVDIITPKLVRVIIGIDDTDTKEKGATWVAGLKLGTQCPIGKFIEHKIVQLNPDAPNKTTNCCGTAVSFAVKESEIPALIEYAADFIRKESYSEDAIMTVFQGLEIPKGLADFGWDCKSILFKPEDAVRVAEENGVQIISLNGGTKGVIGAVAAIGCFDMGEKAAGVPQDFE